MADKFEYRSDEKELLDGTAIGRDLLFQNLKELDFLNRTTGGHSISLNGIKKLITDPSRVYHVADLGCGSGDSMVAIACWARANKFKVRLTGVDNNPDAIEYLKIRCRDYPEITGIAEDYRNFLNRNRSVDIAHCSLFCHHLNDKELLHFFIHCRENLKSGFIINDLQRKALVYYCAWAFPRIFNGSALSKNDGPVSVLRGFKYEELSGLLYKANLRNYSIEKKWGFRFLVVAKTSCDEPTGG